MIIQLGYRSDLTDNIKRSFFQAAVVSILLYGCTTTTLTKRMEKKLDSDYTSILRTVLNKSWRQYSTKQQLYGHLPPNTKIIQVRRTRHTEHCWRSKGELISDVLHHIDEQKKDDQLEHIYNISVPIQDVAWMAPRERWTIEMDGNRRSGRSMLAARDDVNDDEFFWLI